MYCLPQAVSDSNTGHFSHPTELAKNGCILSKVACCLLMVVKALIKQYVI